MRNVGASIARPFFRIFSILLWQIDKEYGIKSEIKNVDKK